MSVVLSRGSLALWLLVGFAQREAPAGIGREGYQWGKGISFPRSLCAESWNWPRHTYCQATLSRQPSLSTVVVTSPSFLLPPNSPILLSLSNTRILPILSDFFYTLPTPLEWILFLNALQITQLECAFGFPLRPDWYLTQNFPKLLLLTESLVSP